MFFSTYNIYIMKYCNNCGIITGYFFGNRCEYCKLIFVTPIVTPIVTSKMNIHTIYDISDKNDSNI